MKYFHPNARGLLSMTHQHRQRMRAHWMIWWRWKRYTIAFIVLTNLCAMRNRSLSSSLKHQIRCSHRFWRQIIDVRTQQPNKHTLLLGGLSEAPPQNSRKHIVSPVSWVEWMTAPLRQYLLEECSSLLYSSRCLKNSHQHLTDILYNGFA